MRKDVTSLCDDNVFTMEYLISQPIEDNENDEIAL